MAENTLSLPVRPQCAVFKSEHTLSRCNGCQVVFYCGRDHQTNDWPQHKATCTPTKKTRNKLNAEIEALNSMPSTFGFEEKPFENCRAFLGNPYDFVKWWFTCDPDGHYNWGNTDLPYLNIKNANAFEPYDSWRMDFPDLSQLSMLCLVKLCLLFNLEAIEAARKATSGKLPVELVDQVRSNIANSAASSNQAFMDDVESGRPLVKHTENLTDQTAILFAAVNRANQQYWKGVLAPGKHLKARPPFTYPGDVSEMQVTLAQTYDA